jgi:predicted aspartyl protease
MHQKLKLELVPIEEEGCHIFIRGRINGKPARFLVDTGASRTVLDIARIARFFPENEADLEKMDSFSAGLGTNTMESHTVVLHTLSFGRIILRDYKAAALNLQHVNESYGMMKLSKIDGVIGGDLLQRLNAVIDYRHHHIILERY